MAEHEQRVHTQEEVAALTEDLAAGFAELITAALAARGVSSECRSCGVPTSWSHWTLVPAPAIVPLISAEDDVIPCAFIICRSCGYVRLHALAALGVALEQRRIIMPGDLTGP